MYLLNVKENNLGSFKHECFSNFLSFVQHKVLLALYQLVTWNSHILCEAPTWLSENVLKITVAIDQLEGSESSVKSLLVSGMSTRKSVLNKKGGATPKSD